MTPFDPLGFISGLLTAVTAPLNLILLLVLTIFESLLGIPTFCSSPAFCL